MTRGRLSQPSRWQSTAQAFSRYLTPGAPDECWPWQGTRREGGYGIFGSQYRSHRAHRVAYELAKGPIPKGLVVRHSCDNPPCCNPAHLLLGTIQDNNEDKMRRRRNPHGERAYQARLSEQDVRAIRARAAKGESPTAMGREFGVSEATIRSAATRKNWKHVLDTDGVEVAS